jgi:dTDP-4-dehydrorhamnose 3,5-epimerase
MSCRTTSPSTRSAASPAASTPSPGTSSSPWPRALSSAPGWTCARALETYGKVYTTTLDPSRAIYVPRGVGNSFQALEDGTAYTYLVDAHWSAELKKTYTFVNLADPALGIEWPIPLSEATLSEADKGHPMLADVVPMAPRRTLVTGCNGQLGRAVRALAEERGVSPPSTSATSTPSTSPIPPSTTQYDWDLYGTVINCGAYTAVDRAETPEGRLSCLEGQRDRAGASRPHLRGARHHARPHLLRLRLRRHPRAA